MPIVTASAITPALAASTTASCCTQTAYPATGDPGLQALRPTSTPVQTLNVGPTCTYTTISSAIAAIAKRSAATMANRVDIIVCPGTYAENVALPNGVALVGATGNRADVVITGAASTTMTGVVTSNGESYLEGLTIKRPTYPGEVAGSWPKYPIHWSGGAFGVVANCDLLPQSSTAAGAPSSFGMDGTAGSTTVIYGTTLGSVITTGGNSTNTHGWSFNTTGLKLAFVNCKVVTGLAYSALQDTYPDDIWVTNCTLATGGTAGSGSLRIYGAVTQLHLSGTATPGGIFRRDSNNVTLTNAAQDSNSNYPLPSW